MGIRFSQLIRSNAVKVIIAGGRDYELEEADFLLLDSLHSKYNFTEVVSGTARGIDTDGEYWANLSKIPIKRFPANWVKHGKAAGFIRNTEMANYADALIAFEGGNGTQHMVQQARKLGLKIILNVMNF